MKSICIKNNNQDIINYLLDSCLNIDLNSIYISNHTFSIYENVIIHYCGNDYEAFYDIISNILCDCIITYYEEPLIKRLINFDYFYFSDIEKRHIFDMCLEILEDIEDDYYCREDLIKNAIYYYIKKEKSMILDGFVNFRLYDYVKLMDSLVDSAVNRYLIEKEYLEFVNILKLYINSSVPTQNLVHLIYSNSYATLVDENKQIISTNDEILKAKYLSDISFSVNDYVLNTLLNIIPKKIIIHLTDNYVDEFINTLQLIFENRITICNDCNLCQLYRLNTNIKQ